MDKDIFEEDFNRRYKVTSLQISPAGSSKEYVISNEEVTKALVVRTEFSCLDEKTQMYERKPAPFLNVEAVVFFKFTLADIIYPPDFIVLIYDNTASRAADFLIFRTEELKSRLEKIPLRLEKGGYYNLLLWIFRDNFVFVASNLPGKGGWYMPGGLDGGGDCMAR